ncbi:MAG TPA: glycosyltransferase family 4 protein [Nitrospiraceae bacterium]|nr:glycosyltransferase family 4 protein [Nitrospiraceae bacterium]
MYRSKAGCSGGAEFQLFLLANALSADPGYRVSVLTTVNDGVGTEQTGPVTLIKRRPGGRLGGTCWRPTLKVVRGYVEAFFEMFALFRSINADVYIHAGAGVEVGAYALICRLLHRRFVFVVASSADLCEPYGKVGSPLRSLYPLGVRFAHTVICRSEEQHDWLRARFHREGTIIRSAHAEIEPQGGNRGSSERHTLLWVGRVTPVKRPHQFLNVVRRFSDEPCTMVIMKDDGYPDLWLDIREQAAALPNLRVHENVPWHAMSRFFEEAKALVCTSEYEGFPNTFVQAAMAGAPIVSWSVDPDGVLARHRIGVCAAGSFEQLLLTTQQFLSSRSLRDEYGRRAYAYANEYHRLSGAAERYKHVFRSLVKTGSKSRSSSA